MCYNVSMTESKLQKRINDEIKSGTSKDLMTHEERAFFSSLTDEEEIKKYKEKFLKRIKLNQI